MNKFNSLLELHFSQEQEGWCKGVVLSSKFKIDPYQRCYTLVQFSDSTLQIQFRLWGKDETEVLKTGTVLEIFLQKAKEEYFFNVPMIENQAAYNIKQGEKVSDYLMHAPVSYKKMLTEITEIVSTFKDAELKSVCGTF